MRSLILAVAICLMRLSSFAQSGDDKLALKVSGHDFEFKSAPEQCTSVSYKEVATGVVKDAGGTTPRTVRLAPKLYEFTCKCPSGDVTSAPTMVGQVEDYTFQCKAALPETPVHEVSGICKLNRDDKKNVNDNKMIGDQNLFHIRCAVPGAVTTCPREQVHSFGAAWIVLNSIHG